MKSKKPIDALILDLRGQKVILDADLAELYGVPTKRLNEAVKRNADRFPEDFLWQLTLQEWAHMRSQFATTRADVTAKGSDDLKPSPRAHNSHGGRRNLPHAFTEHGAIMAATVLNSPEAVAVSVYVVRTFIQMREQIVTNAAVLKRLAEIDKTLLKHDQSLQIIWAKLQPLIQPPPEPPRKKIGFAPH
jgi:hypothetical protein